MQRLCQQFSARAQRRPRERRAVRYGWALLRFPAHGHSLLVCRGRRRRRGGVMLITSSRQSRPDSLSVCERAMCACARGCAKARVGHAREAAGGTVSEGQRETFTSAGRVRTTCSSRICSRLTSTRFGGRPLRRREREREREIERER